MIKASLARVGLVAPLFLQITTEQYVRDLVAAEEDGNALFFGYFSALGLE